jgi:WD40 repeat protein
VVSASEDGTVTVWDENGAPVGNPLEGHQGEVLAIAVGRLGGRDVIVSATEKGTVQV